MKNAWVGTPGFFLDKTQAFFQIVGQGGHQSMFVGLGHSPAVNPSQIVVVDEHSQDRFHRAASPFSQKAGVVLFRSSFGAFGRKVDCTTKCLT